MKNKKVVKLAEKKLKKANKWLKKFGDVDMGHLDGTYDQVNKTKEICEMILSLDEAKKNFKIKKNSELNIRVRKLTDNERKKINLGNLIVGN